jgi:hypothetical protein
MRLFRVGANGGGVNFMRSLPSGSSIVSPARQIVRLRETEAAMRLPRRLVALLQYADAHRQRIAKQCQ